MKQKLTPEQIDLFCNLAKLKEEGRLFEPIRPIPVEAERYVVYLRGEQNFFFNDYGDIDALCAVGLVDYSLSRMGTAKLFSITKAGEKLYREGEISADVALERIDRLKEATTVLKGTLGYMLNGESLSRALTEINFVLGQVNVATYSEPRIRESLKRVQEMIANRYHFVPLSQAVEVSGAFGDWARVLFSYLDLDQPGI